LRLADTHKEQLFCEHYAQTGNATKSAEIVGYINNSRQMGYYLKNKHKHLIQQKAFEILHTGVPLAISVLQDLMANSKSDMVKFTVASYILKLCGYTSKSLQELEQQQKDRVFDNLLSSRETPEHEKAEYYLETFELLKTSIESLPEKEQRVIADNTDDITAIVETVKKAKSM